MVGYKLFLIVKIIINNELIKHKVVEDIRDRNVMSVGHHDGVVLLCLGVNEVDKRVAGSSQHFHHNWIWLIYGFN